jgi:hypothetical protein
MHSHAGNVLKKGRGVLCLEEGVGPAGFLQKSTPISGRWKHACLFVVKVSGYIEERVVLLYSALLSPFLVDLLLLVHAQLARTHVDQEKQTTTMIRE